MSEEIAFKLEMICSNCGAVLRGSAKLDRDGLMTIEVEGRRTWLEKEYERGLDEGSKEAETGP